MIDAERLKILKNGAKFDVSCSSSGSARKREAGGFGNAAPAGICHSFAPDGRCVSLLKILLTNRCAYDCKYCVNRRSNDVPRASATPDEICRLTVEFYKRNYIEGLFLSSAVEGSPDRTMELLCETAVRLRKLYGFHGYLHVKGIPGADPALVDRTALYADRMSFNLELPSEGSLRLLAPQKTKEAVLLPMRRLADEAAGLGKERTRRFLPAGQTTQMIVGASPERDGQILRLTQGLYRKFGLKRVYYSSFLPVTGDAALPAEPAGLLREHRLYQADWLLRFYGFSADEIATEDEDLDPALDPKCAWALRHPELFPVEANTAPLEVLLRVPGIGLRSAANIVTARRRGALDYEALARMRVTLKRAKHFLTVKGKFFGAERADRVRELLSAAARREEAEQLSLFSLPEIASSALTGEL